MIKFTLPLRVQKSKKKKFSLNLNQYRVAHYQTLNKAKVEFKRLFELEYGHCQVEPIKTCRLEYTIFFPDNRVTDVANVGSIVDKFASDCLTELGYIDEDNRRVVKEVIYRDGGIDRENPRAELILKEID